MKSAEWITCPISCPDSERHLGDHQGNPGKALSAEYQELTVVDFSDLAQGCKTYDEFVEKMAQIPESTLQYLGLSICGPKKKVNKLTGSMPLLR